MKKVAISIALTLSTLLAQESDLSQEIAKISNEASQKLLNTLGGELKARIEKDGIVKAADFCADRAIPLTEEISKQFGQNISIKRISLKHRNPANTPLENEQEILKSLETLKNAGVALPDYLIQKVGDTTYKYYKPLLINNEVCLKCHGTENSLYPEVKNFLAKRYPLDTATGYKMNDLRGAVVVTIKK